MFMRLKHIYLKHQFEPGFLGLFINPFYFARKGLCSGVRSFAGHLFGNILDIGCGKKPYKHFFVYEKYVGMDIEQSGHSHKNEDIDVYYDGRTFPFPDESFDCALSSQVFEHVFYPDGFIKEINRILKPNGMLLLTVPFVWDEHEQPYDFARYTSFALKHIFENNGFQIVEFNKSMNDVRVIFQIINAFIFKLTANSNSFWNLLMTFLFMAPFNILGEICSKILPKNDDLYLDNIILVRKIANA